MPKEKKIVNVPERVKKIADSSITRGNMKDLESRLDNRKIKKPIRKDGLFLCL